MLGALALGTTIAGATLPAAADDKADARFSTVAGSALTGHTPASASAAADAVKVAGYLKQWRFDTNHRSHPLLAKPSFSGRADRNYNLYNSREHRFLQWERQTFGINLGWTDDASPATAVRKSRWFFTRPTNTSSPLRYGDKVAIGYGGSPSYIRYANRLVGVNLNWSSRPVFEWKILGGRIGQPVQSGHWVALYNQKAGDALIHFDRTVGGDIGWPSSETWGKQIKDAVMRAIRDHWKEAVAYLLTA